MFKNLKSRNSESVDNRIVATLMFIHVQLTGKATSSPTGDPICQMISAIAILKLRDSVLVLLAMCFMDEKRKTTKVPPSAIGIDATRSPGGFRSGMNAKMK